MADPDVEEELVGKIGRVTVPIPRAGPGEIFVPIRGGTEAFAAWADEEIPRDKAVVVVEVRSPRSVTVTPFPEADL
ncbi:MAG TPA: hypothetical protein VE990_07800 [Acidimicrobiales bacterium]|nr:hypothetical protein [Acidimicrobiales bacterium]